MNKKIILASVALLSLTLVGCGAKKDAKENAAKENKAKVEATNNAKKADEAVALKDGTYTGKSSEDDYGGHIEVTITVADGKISETVVKNLQKDGSEKGEDYGKEAGEEGHKTAQMTLEASQTYGKELTEKGSVEKVEAVSGATQSYNQFVEAANDAINQAK
ncbi:MULTISPECIES: FMN-binding protein [Peptoniphilus]|uniref:FMN-binding protein n=1 Tax=Peptoniphilus TaxID=162289 RepID=UPI000782BC31|nr:MULTISPECIES: FMN-binding protein [Peptoniphilus]KXB70871.1 FMN-binding domain protein [Peptoniphilus sp. DNF00840]